MDTHFCVCLSQFLVVDSYLARDVHTEESISEGRQELKKILRHDGGMNCENL